MEISNLLDENLALKQENTLLKKIIRNNYSHINKYVNIIAKMDDLLTKKRSEIQAMKEELGNSQTNLENLKNEIPEKCPIWTKN